MAYTYSNFRVEHHEDVLVVHLSRPESLNAFNRSMHSEAVDLLREIAADTSLKAVVLSGDGRAFSAGGDINMMREMNDDIPAFQAQLGEARAILQSLLLIAPPVIAAVNGHAIGLGCTIALFCDVVLADPRAKFGDPHVNVGLVAGDGGAVAWPLLTGLSRAKYYLMTGELMTATEAERLGIVTKVVEEGQALTEGLALANKLASGPVSAIRWTKQALNKWLEFGMTLAGDTGLALEGASQVHPDHREAVSAFLEKRAPAYRR